MQYVLAAAEEIKKTAHWEIDVEVDLFHASSGANILVGGLFKGRTLVYSDLTHVVLRISPKYASEAGDSAILVSSHIDTVFSGSAFHIHHLFLFDYLLSFICFQVLSASSFSKLCISH